MQQYKYSNDVRKNAEELIRTAELKRRELKKKLIASSEVSEEKRLQNRTASIERYRAEVERSSPEHCRQTWFHGQTQKYDINETHLKVVKLIDELVEKLQRKRYEKDDPEINAFLEELSKIKLGPSNLRERADKLIDERVKRGGGSGWNVEKYLDTAKKNDSFENRLTNYTDALKNDLLQIYYDEHPEELAQLRNQVVAAFTDAYDRIYNLIKDPKNADLSDYDTLIKDDYHGLLKIVVADYYPPQYQTTVVDIFYEQRNEKYRNESLVSSGQKARPPEGVYFEEHRKLARTQTPTEQKQTRMELAQDIKAFADEINRILKDLSECQFKDPARKQDYNNRYSQTDYLYDVNNILTTFRGEREYQHQDLLIIIPLLDKALLEKAVNDVDQLRIMLRGLNYIPLQMAFLQKLGEEKLRSIKDLPEEIVKLAREKITETRRIDDLPTVSPYEKEHFSKKFRQNRIQILLNDFVHNLTLTKFEEKPQQAPGAQGAFGGSTRTVTTGSITLAAGKSSLPVKK